MPALSVLRRGASLGPLDVGIETRSSIAGSDRYPSIGIAAGSIRGIVGRPVDAVGFRSRSSAVCSRASQIIGLTVRSAKSRYHDASSRSFDEFGMSARLVARSSFRSLFRAENLAIDLSQRGIGAYQPCAKRTESEKPAKLAYNRLMVPDALHRVQFPARAAGAVLIPLPN